MARKTITEYSDVTKFKVCPKCETIYTCEVSACSECGFVRIKNMKDVPVVYS